MMELNGNPVTPDELKALALANYGHFTSMRVDDQRVRGLDLHMERLARDCRTVFGVPLDLEQVREYARRAVSTSTGSFVIRITVFDPSLDIGRPAAPATPHVLVTTRPTARLPMPALRVKTVPFTRDTPGVKHLGLFGSLYARRTAQLAGFDDALFVGPNGLVSEGGTWNAGFIDGQGNVVWPKADMLPGVTMALLQQRHDSTTATISLAAACGMQAAFATNTTIGVRAISAIDETTLPAEHPVLTALRQAYQGIPGEEI
ncbi:aminotransferase class IV family protein [Streptomyces sp. B1866]|uniref:aminotransferase class IV family protein n=1 Tax=Streptomyces sp. B1866 TaxID=3075431 RepID=UPI0028919230|nr:aminotransferase class IV family protein [Streptomyces sp. B1866]MDT3397429.1 aminotransferase class IV family protein [Streptomyces sp. B1866]